MTSPSPASASTIVMIPARLAASRLPNKPLAELAGAPMIVQVWRRAVEAEVGPVVVACAEPAIAAAITGHGGEAVLTDPALPSGTDRIRAALAEIDPAGRFEQVINLQGDLPTVAPATIRAVLRPLDELACDIGTAAVATTDPAECQDPNVVKAVIAFSAIKSDLGRALYFSRSQVPFGGGPCYHHIGIYAYRRRALDRFAELPPSPLERRERLEQLRALESGMTIGVAVVDAVPLGVDTPAQLERARAMLERGTAGRP
jgi:3-deoxy-manno-octulosonate cytidylyltransferase (CMP-KDO synthetase)